MNALQKLSRLAIKKSFYLSVRIIALRHDMQAYRDKHAELRSYPAGTLGHDISKCLDQNQLQFVPGYESHDLKHVVLDYKMTPVDEIRMQAFMLGNGNYTLPCFAILLFGALLLPDLWPVFYRDFILGTKSLPISLWTIEGFGEQQTQTLRKQVIETNPNRQSLITMKRLTQFGALASILAGIFGMIFCLPYLYSANMTDLVGAGFPFIGGAILLVGGLIVLSNFSKQETHKTAF